jgi:hypothetical protein
LSDKTEEEILTIQGDMETEEEKLKQTKEKVTR